MGVEFFKLFLSSFELCSTRSRSEINFDFEFQYKKLVLQIEIIL